MEITSIHIASRRPGVASAFAINRGGASYSVADVDSLTESPLSFARRGGVDSRVRPPFSEWIATEAVRADWVLPGIEEGLLLTGHDRPEDVARFYRERGAKLVVVKLGAEGAYYDSDVAGTGRVAGFPVKEVIDTVGAGDGFAAGVVSALLEGRSVPEAVRRGAWIGARAVQVLGDTEGLPTRAELEAAGL